MNNLKNNKKWEQDKKIIPGGNMLISKRSEFLLPHYWPAYYKKAKDCHIWDLDNKKYLDMFFGVGTNVLGYCNKNVDNKVIKSIKKGNMSSLNSYNEILLAKKLIKMHSWASMAKFAKTGGEANAIAIRIARAACKKNKNIAFCGYHGWHDWYLSSILNNKKNLNNHLIEGLDNSGLPVKLKNTAFPFDYNNFKMLNNLVKHKNIGIIEMEVQRNYSPKDGFLTKVRDLAKRKNIILIFDECTSGFRETYGGLHKKYKINPDILILGKALGNGYPITAVIGKKRIMKFANKTFISSTYWSDDIGFTAALATLNEMRIKKPYKTLKIKGKYIKKNWIRIAKKYGFKLKVSGIDAIPSFNFLEKFNQKAITFITQQMLKYKIIASNVIYLSITHNNKNINRYLYYFEKILSQLSKVKNKKKLNKLIKGKERQSHFKRLN